MGEPLDMTDDQRPKRHGWAPGSYICVCFECNKQFVGDKRAIMCAPCAYYEFKAEESPQPNTPAEQSKEAAP